MTMDTDGTSDDDAGLPPDRPLHRILISVMFAGTVALIIWAAATRLTGITRATGVVVPDTQNQIVQHLEGGIVSVIKVREGDRIMQGDILLAIDSTQSKLTLQQTLTQLASKRAALARTEAELADADDISFPPDLADASLQANERELFAKRRRQRKEEHLLLGDKIRQQRISLAGSTKRLENENKERKLVSERLESIRNLNRIGAASQNELLQAMSALQDIETKIDDLEHQIPQTEAALSEAVREQSAAALRSKSAAAEDKTKLLAEISQLMDASASLRERLDRTEVRAPVSGIVNKMMIATVGGVVAPGQPLIEIVPDSDTIAIEAQLSPQDRAQIWPGTKAIAKVTAYDFSVYGGLEANVVGISPDVIKETGREPYFRVRLKAPSSLDGKHPVIPGMVVDVDMVTKDYTILEYLVSPLVAGADLALRQ